MVIDMSDSEHDRLVNLIVQREALKHASGATDLERVLASISAEITARAAEQKRQERTTAGNTNVTVVKSALIDATRDESSWPLNTDFPLTPVEAWYILQGYAVKPTHGISDDMVRFLGGKVEIIDGYLRLRGIAKQTK
jgi:hypothetical protein